jgi:hypothetical protein
VDFSAHPRALPAAATQPPTPVGSAP